MKTNVKMKTKSDVLPNTVGIEYTFVPEITGTIHTMKRIAILAANAFKASPDLPDRVKANVRVDDGAVEVPSPVFKTSDAILDFSNTVFHRASQNYLTPRLVRTEKDGSERYYGTGGGHVHVGFPREMVGAERELFLRNVAVDSANQFYVNWFFQEWHDNDTLPNCMIENLRNRGEGLRGKTVATYAKDYRNFPVAIRQYSRHLSLWKKKNHNTLEFRLFDAPRTTEMVMKNVDFAIAYTQHIKRLTQQGKVIPLKRREILERKEMTADEVKSRLKRLFTKLDLDYTAYHATYWPNYEMRAEYGKL